MDQVRLGRQVAPGIIVNGVGRAVRIIARVRKVIVDEQAAEFDADVFLRERLIREVSNDIVAVGNPIRAAARGSASW